MIGARRVRALEGQEIGTNSTGSYRARLRSMAGGRRGRGIAGVGPGTSSQEATRWSSSVPRRAIAIQGAVIHPAATTTAAPSTAVVVLRDRRTPSPLPPGGAMDRRERLTCL